jgi:hypothetical protein
VYKNDRSIMSKTCTPNGWKALMQKQSCVKKPESSCSKQIVDRQPGVVRNHDFASVFV